LDRKEGGKMRFLEIAYNILKIGLLSFIFVIIVVWMIAAIASP